MKVKTVVDDEPVEIAILGYIHTFIKMFFRLVARDLACKKIS